MNILRPKLSISEKLCYGLGHVLNDFTASMWFSYLLIFLHRVVNFKSKTAGYMILIGQIVDAASTVLLGFLSDKTKNGICHYGRRKSWHLLGVICVLMSFPFSFNLCLTCSGESATSELIQFLYYIPFCVIFQFGWACSQISHLALIPELSRDETERVSLNSIRYAFTVMSNLFVYIATFITLRVNIGESTSASAVVRTSRSSGSEAMAEDVSTQLTRADAPKFTFLSGIVCIVGLFTQIVFHLGTRENKRRRSCSIAPPPLPASSMATIADAEAAAMKQPPVNVTMVDLKHDWRDYMKSSRFYMVALLYMSTRLIINLCQIYMPMYLTDSVELNKHSIALIPLICYLSGFISTFPLSQITKVFHSCKTCLFGICLIIICCVLFWFHELIYDKTVNAIVSSIILGIGSTVISVTSLSIISELIGDKIASSAFVYGIMSFTDKISSGVAVVFLEEFSPCQINSQAASCKHFYFYVMSLFPLLCCFFSIIALIVLHLQMKDFKKVNPLDDISKKGLQKY